MASCTFFRTKNAKIKKHSSFCLFTAPKVANKTMLREEFPNQSLFWARSICVLLRCSHLKLSIKLTWQNPRYLSKNTRCLMNSLTSSHVDVTFNWINCLKSLLQSGNQFLQHETHAFVIWSAVKQVWEESIGIDISDSWCSRRMFYADIRGPRHFLYSNSLRYSLPEALLEFCPWQNGFLLW